MAGLLEISDFGLRKIRFSLTEPNLTYFNLPCWCIPHYKLAVNLQECNEHKQYCKQCTTKIIPQIFYLSESSKFKLSSISRI